MALSFKTIITKKKAGQPLSYEEIQWMVSGFINEEIPDYQMASFLATIYFQGMNHQEIADLTQIYVESGKTYDLSAVKGWKADKHSTGGVGDKITFIFSPLVASYGIKVAKLSGRALGQTGGTIDKLESIPNWNSEISEDQFKKIVTKVGMSIIGASPKIAPADKKIYALRDVIEMVDSIPLIAASVMAKKLVIDADSIVLDVKMGSGAFMKDLDSAIELSKLMVAIGHAHQRKVVALITEMNKPLGRTIGNALEVKEAYETLQGQGCADVVEVASVAAAVTLVKAGIFKDLKTAQKDVLTKLKTGETLHYLTEMIEAQGGDASVMNNYEKHFVTKNEIQVLASATGYLEYFDAQQLGFLAVELGAGRKTKDDVIDHAAGIYLNKVNGEKVEIGDVVMTLKTNKKTDPSWTKMATSTFKIVKTQAVSPVIKKIIE